MKFDHNNKFDLCYYGQVNSLRLKSIADLKWASKKSLRVTLILLAIVQLNTNCASVARLPVHQMTIFGW